MKSVTPVARIDARRICISTTHLEERVAALTERRRCTGRHHTQVYAHVEECNDGARSCYAANGFVEVPQTAAAVGRKGGKGGRRGGGKGGELSAAELLGTTTILLRRGL